MRTTLAIDDALLTTASRLTGVTEKSALVREGLRALIERKSARRLAKLGGTEPEAAMPARRKPAQLWFWSRPRSGSIISGKANHSL